MKSDVHIENKQVGPAVRRCRWTRNKAGDTYETVCGGEKIYVVRRYPKQWVLRVNGQWLPYVFTGPKAAQRYAAGGVMKRQENPVPVIGIAAAAATGTVAGFALGKKSRKAKQQNPIGEIALGAAMGAIAGGIAGYTVAVPDLEAKFDLAEKLIAENKPKEASDQLVEIVSDVEAVQSRLGGSAPDIRRRLKALNARLPGKWQIFALQQNPEMAPKAVRALKNRLLR